MGIPNIFKDFECDDPEKALNRLAWSIIKAVLLVFFLGAGCMCLLIWFIND